MKILGLDSSGLVAGVAVVEDDILLAEYTTNYKKTHSQTLLPMLEEISRMIELDLETVDAIAVASGPGSFTGLRIGAATAKGLGFALNKPLVEVPTLEGLAYNLCGVDSLVCPLIDARRNQVYTGIYEFAVRREDSERSACRENQEGKVCQEVPRDNVCREDPEDNAHREVKPESQSGENYECRRLLRVVEPQAAVDISVIADRINRLGAEQPCRSVIFLGDGVPVYRQAIREQVRIPYSFAPACNNRQRAASVAALGALYYEAGHTVTAAAHRPEYLRKSQAERERDAGEEA